MRATVPKALVEVLAAGLLFASSPTQAQGTVPSAGKARNPIGVFLRCTGKEDPLEAIKAVQSLGLEHIQVSGLPDRFYTQEGAKEFAAMLRDTGVRADAVVAVFAGESYKDRNAVVRTVGFRPLPLLKQRLLHARRCVDFAAGIGAGIVTFHMGFLPEDPDNLAYRAMLAAVTDVAEYGSRKGITISLETGQETGDQLAAFLDRITAARVGVNFDTANLVIYGVESPPHALRRLVTRVTSVHVKDALPPEQPSLLGREVRLGEGRAGVRECLAILRDSGFQGPLIIENYVWRELHTDSLEELRRARQFLLTTDY